MKCGTEKGCGINKKTGKLECYRCREIYKTIDELLAADCKVPMPTVKSLITAQATT